MIIGYARVSTDGQTLDAQLTSLKAAGAEKVFSEKISGAVTDRKALAKAISALGPGDILLEPISKSPEEDNEAGELNEAKEVLWMIFPSDEDPALPLDPGKEAFDQPAPQEASHAAPVLRRRFHSVRAVRRDHLDAILT